MLAWEERRKEDERAADAKSVLLAEAERKAGGRRKIIILSHGDARNVHNESRIEIRDGNRTFWYYDPRAKHTRVLCLTVQAAQSACYIEDPKPTNVFMHDQALPNVILRPLQDDTGAYRSVVIDCSAEKPIIYAIPFPYTINVGGVSARCTILSQLIKEIQDIYPDDLLDIYMIFCSPTHEQVGMEVKQLKALPGAPLQDIRLRYPYTYEAALPGRERRKAREEEAAAAAAAAEEAAARAAAPAAKEKAPLERPKTLTAAQKLLKRLTHHIPPRTLPEKPKDGGKRRKTRRKRRTYKKRKG